VRRAISGAIAALSLGACLGAPVAYFLGALEAGAFRLVFALASLGWFAGAAIFTASRES
jgi:hypothetical protein